MAFAGSLSRSSASFPSVAETTELAVRLEDNDLPAEYGKFVSADLHVHMNYGGHYRSTPRNPARAAEAEDLDVVHNLSSTRKSGSRTSRISCRAATRIPRAASALLFHAQEFHTSFWGHMGLLHLADH